MAKNIGRDILKINNQFFLSTIKTDENFNAPQRKNIDWKQKYPYPAIKEYQQHPIKHRDDRKTYFAAQNPFLVKIYDVLDKYSRDYFVFNDACKYVSKQLNNFMGDRIVLDAYGMHRFFLDNGHMTYERPYKPMNDELYNITQFNQWLKNKDIDFLYVVLPAPVGDENSEAAVRTQGYQVYSNVMANELVNGFNDSKINYIDTRTMFFYSDQHFDDLFFRYEHHITPKYGLRIAEEVANYVDSRYNVQTDNQIFSWGKYLVTEAEKKDGFMNNRLLVYDGKEKIDFLHPLYDVSIDKYIGDYDLNLSGNFDDVMYAMWDYPTYNTWNHGIKALKTYRNRNVVSGPKILLLTESYSDVISPFIACAYNHVDEIDLRIFDGSLEKYIEDTKPDIVIMIYSAYDINSKGAETLFELQ